MHGASPHRVIRQLVKRLQRDYRPIRMIVFGSYARGRPNKDSDVDLLIVKATRQPFHRRLFTVRQLASPILQGQPFDPLVITPQELTRRLREGDQFLQEIVTKGKLVYDRA